MKPADAIRDYVRRHDIEPARRRGQERVKIIVGDVHRSLGLTQRVPAVCSALRSKAFLKANDLTLEDWTGPPSGQSTTVEFTYRLGSGEPQQNRRSASELFYSMRGIAKEAFRELGGGEAFLRAERDQWYGAKSENS